MPPTNKKIVNDEQLCKQKARKHISIEQKIIILKELDKGTPLRKVARLFHLPKSTVDSIRGNRAKILECSSYLSSNVAGKTMRVRNSRIHITETLLYTWIAQQREKNITLNESMVRSKALEFFQDVKVENKVECSFLATHGWFMNFKSRFKLKDAFLADKPVNADIDAALKFTVKFKSIISEGGYCPQQVFNCVETGLNWKKFPTRTYVTDYDKASPGLKTSNDRVTLFLGSNASGDAKLKPLMLHPAQNPRALKDIDKDDLPVIWCSNSKSQISTDIFTGWFITYFVPFIENYNAEHGLENKALLLVDKASGHPTDLNANYPHINVIFSPPKTTSVLQPMDSGIISIFNAHYLEEVMRRIISTTSTSDDDMAIFWKNFNIKDALEVIAISWDSITMKALNEVWRAIWPECVTTTQSDIMENCTEDIPELAIKAENCTEEIPDFTIDGEKFPELIIKAEKCMENIPEITINAGLESFTVDNIEAQENGNDDSFMNDELITLEHKPPIEDLSDNGTNVNMEKQNLLEMLDLADKLKKKLRVVEENVDTSNLFCSVLDSLMIKYKKKNKDMK